MQFVGLPQKSQGSDKTGHPQRHTWESKRDWRELRKLLRKQLFLQQVITLKIITNIYMQFMVR